MGLKVITVTCAGNVEAVVVANDDEADTFAAQIRAADAEGDLHVQVLTTDSLNTAIEYARSN